MFFLYNKFTSICILKQEKNVSYTFPGGILGARCLTILQACQIHLKARQVVLTADLLDYFCVISKHEDSRSTTCLGGH